MLRAEVQARTSSTQGLVLEAVEARMELEGKLKGLADTVTSLAKKVRPAHPGLALSSGESRLLCWCLP